jgi:hypothetical protein
MSKKESDTSRRIAMTPIHSLIAIALQQTRILVCLLLIASFLNNGYAQELASDAVPQRNLEQSPFQFEPSLQFVEKSRHTENVIKDGFAVRNLQLDQIPSELKIEADLSALNYHRKQIIFSPSSHWQQNPLKASGSGRLSKFLTAAAFTALGAYFLATSESEQVFRNDGFFSIYRSTPEGRECIENCPYLHTDRDWRFGAGIASLSAAAGFLYWGIESSQ